MDAIGERLKEERLRNGWSQKDLAQESKTNVDTISGIETGQHEPRPSTLRKLAKALDIEVRDLFEESALSGKGEAPATRPLLLERALDAVRQDEMKDSRAMARLAASEGVPQSASEYEEDKLRAELRAGGVPDEYFEGFIWPLVIEVNRLRKELAMREGHQRAFQQ